MSAAQGGRAVALVGASILLVADADMLGVEQANHGGEHGFAGEASALQVPFDAPSKLGKAFPEFEQAFVLGTLAFRAKVGVVAILLASTRIDPCRLQMPVGIGAEPGLLIGGRQADRIQPVDFVPIGDAFSVGIEIGPITALPLPADPWLGVAAMPQHVAY